MRVTKYAVCAWIMEEITLFHVTNAKVGLILNVFLTDTYKNIWHTKKYTRNGYATSVTMNYKRNLFSLVKQLHFALVMFIFYHLIYLY